MAKRKYTEQEITSALTTAAACATLSEAQRMTGISRHTLRQWQNGTRNSALVEKVQPKVAEDSLLLSDKFEAMAHALVDSMASKVQDAKLQNVAVAAGICVDKAQLLKGRATSISQSVLSDQQRIEVAVKQLIEETKLQMGEIVSRQEAARQLLPYMPEASAALKSIIAEEEV